MAANIFDDRHMRILIQRRAIELSRYIICAVHLPSRHLFKNNNEIKNKNLFKVNKKDTRTTSITPFWYLYS